MQSVKWLVYSAFLLQLAACASIPDPLRGEYPGATPAAVGPGQVGSQVRWGGILIATNPEPEQTCFEILGKTLEESARPIESEESQGRFIACKPGFQDPEIFKSGRDVTIIGRINRFEPRNIGEYEYRYPIVDAQVVYLWPERPDYADRPYYYHPYFWSYPYPYYWYPYPYFRPGLHGQVHIRKP